MLASPWVTLGLLARAAPPSRSWGAQLRAPPLAVIPHFQHSLQEAVAWLLPQGFDAVGRGPVALMDVYARSPDVSG